MPIQYRNFYLKKLAYLKEKEAEEWNRASRNSEGQAPQSSHIVKGPAIERR